MLFSMMLGMAVLILAGYKIGLWIKSSQNKQSQFFGFVLMVLSALGFGMLGATMVITIAIQLIIQALTSWL